MNPTLIFHIRTRPATVLIFPQGLLSLYEKDDSRKIDNKRQKQVDVLEQLRVLYVDDAGKAAEVVAKLIELYPTIGNARRAAALVRLALTGKEEYVDALPILKRSCALLLDHEASLFPAKVLAVFGRSAA